MDKTHPPKPFWIEQAEPGDIQLPHKSIGCLLRLYSIFIGLAILALVISVVYKLNPVLAIFFMIISATSWLAGTYRRKSMQRKFQAALEVQEITKTRIGASIMGSAVHVAGHPQLEREQDVVLALIDSEIQIFDYEGSNHGSIPLNSILSLQTVVYDDERVPHIDTIDSTAQALQITFQRGEKIFKALFRRMKRVRPIDWYHAIHQVLDSSDISV